MSNTQYRKALADTQLEYYDVRQAVEDIQPGAYEKLPYTSKVLAEQLGELLVSKLKVLYALSFIAFNTRNFDLPSLIGVHSNPETTFIIRSNCEEETMRTKIVTESIKFSSCFFCSFSSVSKNLA